MVSHEIKTMFGGEMIISSGTIGMLELADLTDWP